MYFQKPERKSKKKPGRNSKNWKKFRKPGEIFQKSFDYPAPIYLLSMYVLKIT